jgi:signal transduction histidine kinase
LTQTLNDLQQAQTHLVQTEKMSSLGELVAGVAHEINNPVSFICGNLKHLSAYTQDLLNLLALYQRAAPTPSAEVAAAIAEFDLEFLLDDLPKTLASMQIGADRIRQIVLSLRNFSRFDQTQMKSVNIHDGLDSTIMILQHRLKGMSNRPDIALHKAYGDLPEVMCYAGQLNQVFMNLLSNAIDALEEGMTIPPRPGFMPTIWISTETMPDDRIAIQIIDNGPGMSSATKNQLFQSFFTTKPLGKGTGMGLSISYQIITEKHQGTLSCESRLGEGTTFSIVIPSQPRVIPSMASHRNKTEV